MIPRCAPSGETADLIYLLRNAAAVGCRGPGELTVVYLAVPEPANDLEILIVLGVQPENIWAFELD